MRLARGEVNIFVVFVLLEMGAKRRMGDAMESMTVQIAKLELKEGDVLAVMFPRPLSDEQRKYMMVTLCPVIPQGAKVAIFDGGATLAKLSSPIEADAQMQVDVPPAAIPLLSE